MSGINAVLPRRLAGRLDATWRDVVTVADQLAGRRRSPVIRAGRHASTAVAASGGVSPAAAALPLAVRAMRLVDVTRETADAVSLHLEPLDGAPVHFLAGQFFTVLVTVEDRALRRAYSASSSPLDTRGVSLTVKRVRGGAVSNHLNDRARRGDVLELLGPSGSFTVPPAAGAAARHLVLVGGGSGITPLVAIAADVLAREPGSFVSLVYGNRAAPDVIFHDRLAHMVAQHAGRFTVRHVLSDPPPGWTGGVGLLDRGALRVELARLTAPSELPSEYFVCGPDAMMSEARAALLEQGVPAGSIHEERFTQPHLRSAVATTAVLGPRRIAVRTAGGGAEQVVVAAPGQTVLEAALAAGLAMPYSCAMGGCGACRVRVRRGAVEMEEPNCLSAAERADGYALACVGRASCDTALEVG